MSILIKRLKFERANLLYQRDFTYIDFKKKRFPRRISSVNVTKSVVYLLKISDMKIVFFVQWKGVADAIGTFTLTLHKIYENKGFPWPVLSCILCSGYICYTFQNQRCINYARIRVFPDPISRLFYAVVTYVTLFRTNNA